MNTDPPAQMPSGAASDANSASVSTVCSIGSRPVTRGEGVGGEAVAGGALAPRGDEVVGGGVLLGGSGAQHDVLDLAGMRAAADLGFELGEGVVDLAAALRELADDLVGDAVDLPAARAAGPPPHPERAG